MRIQVGAIYLCILLKLSGSLEILRKLYVQILSVIYYKHQTKKSRLFWPSSMLPSLRKGY